MTYGRAARRSRPACQRCPPCVLRMRDPRRCPPDRDSGSSLLGVAHESHGGCPIVTPEPNGMRCYYWELAVDLPVQVRPTVAPPPRFTVDGVRLGLRPAGRPAQGDRPKGSAVRRALLPSFG